MKRSATFALGFTLLALLGTAAPAWAQDEAVKPQDDFGAGKPQSPPPEAPPPNPPPNSQATQAQAGRQAERDAQRLFQRFAEDAAIIPGGWVEGRFSWEHFNGGADRFLLGGLFAFRVAEGAEVGLDFGYEDVDLNEPDLNGSGLSDINVYGKYRLRGGTSPCALGGLVKIPTADDTKGLGTGKLDFEAFGSCRADLSAVTLTGNLGARYNGSPDPPFPDSRASVLAGAGLIFPAGRRMSVVLEASWESERLDGAKNDARLTLGVQGVNARPGWGLRGAVVLPLNDSELDYQGLFGAVYIY
ncbi:MAG TPA: hypothetical protein VGQ67_05925 [Candidatus Polarisedimenticolia bacterium]|jgi:hypothetical protein|nr:hypothetical protein [Candidatus Polarisedimenticolia bacterium]